MIEDNFDRLKEIWGGSPSVFALLSDSLSNDRGNGESADEENYENEINDHENEEGNVDDETNDGLNTRTVNRDNARPFRAICKENKSKTQHMQKKLSSYQLGIMLLEQTKEELKLKTKICELMNNSIKTTDKAIESLASSVTHLGDSIKDGLALLAQSFTQNSSANYGRPIYNLPPPMKGSFSTSSFHQR